MNKIAVKICMNLNNVSDVKTAEFIFFPKKAVRKFYHNTNFPDFLFVFSLKQIGTNSFVAFNISHDVF